MMQQILVAGAVVLGVFAFRVTYRIIAPERGGDASGHKIQIAEIKGAGHRRPREPDAVVTTGHYAYPYLMHWVLSFLPLRWLSTVDRMFSGIWDALFAVVLLSLVPLDVLSFEGALIAVLLFALTPEFMRPDQSHGLGLSARKPGLLLTTLVFLLVLAWSSTRSVAFVGLAIFLASLIFLSSKFSVQALVFFAVPLAALTTPVALVVVGTGFVLAVLLSAGNYVRILKGHLRHLHDYATEKQYKMFDHRFPNPFRWVVALRQVRDTDDLFELVYRSRLLKGLLDNPYAPGVVITYTYLFVDGRTVAMPTGFHAWILAGWLCFGIISMPHLLFLGQPERYLEYTALPSLVLLAKGTMSLGWPYLLLVPTLLGIGGVVIGVYLWSWIFTDTFYNPGGENALNEVLEWLADRSLGVVLVQPTYKSRRIAWNTGHKVVDTIGGNATTTDESVEEFNRLYPRRYGYVTADVSWLVGRFDPDWVVFDMDKLDEEADPGLEPPASDPVFENGWFQLYPAEVLTDD